MQPLEDSNLDRSKHYDQMAFMVQPSRVGTTGRVGVFNYDQSVFLHNDDVTYADVMPPAYEGQ